MEKKPQRSGRTGEQRSQGSSPGQRSDGRPNGKKKRRPGQGKSTAKKPTAASGAHNTNQGTKQHDYSEYVASQPQHYSFKLYETFAEARSHAGEIAEACATCDRLNVIIKAEGDMNDPELIRIDPKVKVYAGAAWALIHERRLEERWYESPH